MSICSDNISRLKLESLPSFDISTLINNNSTLSSIDTDLKLPSLTNFGYYSIHEFHSSEDIQSTICPRAFSALHFNIRRLVANFNVFHQMLSDMNHSFSIIGLSETKIDVGVDPYKLKIMIFRTIALCLNDLCPMQGVLAFMLKIIFPTQ